MNMKMDMSMNSNKSTTSDMTSTSSSSPSSNSNDGITTSESSSLPTSDTYPSSKLVICCNKIGYVPMWITSFSKNFSFLLIPANFITGLIISTLVGFNISLNIYLLKQLKKKLLNVSRRNVLSVLGISSGLFIGCPTCAGSLFYSVAGFSSLVAFSSLSFYQIVFVAISIPLLTLSVVIMGKILKREYSNSVCRI
jgi:hypothetical protein